MSEKKNKTPKTVILENTTIINISKVAKKQKRKPHYLMVEAIEEKYGK